MTFDRSQRRQLTLKSGKERVLSNRHPWIFAGAIARESGPPDAAIADLLDDRGRLLASGLYSAHSQIRLRALVFGEEELTAGVIRSRITRAIRRREAVLRDGTNAARLVYAEGDDLSGLIIDRYDDVVVVEIANSGLEQLKQIVVEEIGDAMRARVIYFKNDLPARKIERLSLEPEIVGEGDPRAQILENGLRFEVDPREGQKTGFFLDQRDNRALARDLAGGRRVLNLFSYTGAFGVYAAAGGAVEVENVDVSASAIEAARRNHDLNGSGDRARFTVADAFGFVRERGLAGQQAGMLVCDPPAFAKSRGEVERAARGYKDVNLFAMKLVEAGGWMMTFSCSGHMPLDLFQKVIFAAALDAGRRISFVRRLSAGLDHPVSLYCPEGEYLKGFLLQVH
ncbi:MAG TPA: class I SAM-dependent rRNA methyltransferase [Thermoanaerobaculia bacterium]|nr:class I SAM-dependent rRNA methyltransferase [Thermoanaerobaculia bacterium]